MSQQTTVSGIYALLDPVTKEIRYIGCSKHIHKRWINHCKIQTCIKFKSTYLHKWLRSLAAKPLYIVIEETSNIQEREKYWISFYKNEGAKLVNTTDGGEGVCGYKFSDEQKKMISEKTKKAMKNPLIHAKCVEGGNKSGFAERTRVKIKDQFGTQYKSLTEASKIICCSVGAITLAMKDNRKVKGFYFTRT